MPLTVTVWVRACACPGTPHAQGDTIDIRPTLSLEAGLEAEAMLTDAIARFPLEPGAGEEEQERIAAARTRFLRPRWLRAFVEHGAVAWNLVDDKGKPIPFDTTALLADYDLARTVADACDGLYSAAVLRPFLTRPDELSPPGQTVDTISAATELTSSPS